MSSFHDVQRSARRSRVLAIIANALFGVVVITILLAAIWYGMGRDIETRDDIMRQRCRDWDKGITAEMEKYCNGLPGV